MKKILTLGVALTLCSTIMSSTVDAYTATMDSLNQASTASVARARQNAYLDALRRRYTNMYNQSLIYPGYKNIYTQRAQLSNLQRANHIDGMLSSEMTREGEMEEGRERVRPADTARVEAVNPKQIFRKRAINYYVLGGDGTPNTETMSMGNIDGMRNIVPRAQMLSDMYKWNVGATNLTTRDMVRNIGLNRGEVGIDKPSTYSTGSFNSKMMSPYMSTRWMD